MPSGGIRCERAAALLNEITQDDSTFETKGVFELRGGVERYMKTFPEGGLWKGKNYTFDRRRLQVPALKSAPALVADIESKCVVCRRKWDDYIGKHKCKKCDVPVLICEGCRADEDFLAETTLLCPLCLCKHKAPTAQPPLLEKKKRERADLGDVQDAGQTSAKRAAKAAAPAAARLFVGRLPFMVRASELRVALCACLDKPSALGQVELVQWKYDHKSALFYGSCFVQMASTPLAERVVQRSRDGGKAGAGIVLGGKKLLVNFAPLRAGEKWPPAEHEELERPRIPA